MSFHGRVHPDCNYAANPFHECTESCLKKIAEGKGQKVKKKTGTNICALHLILLYNTFA